MNEAYTEAVEDYLKAIYAIQYRHGNVTTNLLSEWLEISPASATNMVKRLAGMGLLVHEPYQGVSLTARGQTVALAVIRRHRLVELFLVEKLGVSWDQARAHAENWEHVLSDKLAGRMAELLGYPAVDPHGVSIPTPDYLNKEKKGEPR